MEESGKLRFFRPCMDDIIHVDYDFRYKSLSLPLSCLFDGWRDKEQHMWAGWAELWGRRVGFTISDLPCVLLQHFFWASPNRTAVTL